MFDINGCSWYIEELSQEEIKEEMEKRYKRGIEGEPSRDGRYFGTTYHDSEVIFLDKELPEDRKRKTLLHELTHCYIGSYITHMEKNYCEEDICDIVANSHDMIHKILEDYFNVDDEKKRKM
jgi:Zn-dependent peptidase ImmA (M78 family)